MNPLINIPQTATVFNGISTWSGTIFDAILPIGLVGAGILVGGLIVYAVVSGIISAVSSVTGGGYEWKTDFPRVDWERLDYMRRRGHDPYDY